MRSKIKQTLKTLGVSPSTRGYKYLVDIIERVVTDPPALNALVKVVYKDVAEQHSATTIAVERCVRNAIEASYNPMDIPMLSDLFGNTIRAKRGCPTNKQYIATVADYIADTLPADEEVNNDDATDRIS